MFVYMPCDSIAIYGAVCMSHTLVLMINHKSYDRSQRTKVVCMSTKALPHFTMIAITHNAL